MKKFAIVVAMAATLAACGGNGSSGGGAGQQIKIVGSSTVYPFTRAVAEQFQRANAGSSAIARANG